MVIQKLALNYLLLGCVFLSGCGTVIKPHTFSTSVLAPAHKSMSLTVSRDKNIICQNDINPGSVLLIPNQGGSDYQFTYSCSGHNPSQVSVSSDFNIGYVMNIVFPIGYLLDPFIGGFWTFNNTGNIYVELEPQNITAVSNINEVRTLTIATRYTSARGRWVTDGTPGPEVTRYFVTDEKPIEINKTTFSDIAGAQGLSPIRAAVPKKLAVEKAYLKFIPKEKNNFKYFSGTAVWTIERGQNVDEDYVVLLFGKDGVLLHIRPVQKRS